MLDIFTSTGTKLFSHPDALMCLQRNGQGTPITIQVAPTSKCNLNCCFCSNVNREKDEVLDIEKLLFVLGELRVIGAKAVELTGGGDPTLYEPINELIDKCVDIGYKVGMITNGVQLKEKVNKRSLDKLTWVRVSLNSLDYVKKISIPKMKGTLGFSYVLNEKTPENVQEILHKYAVKHNAKYVRIVPNCQTTLDKQIENNKVYSEEVKEWGTPFFYQPKEFRKPKNCWWGYFKPFILHDGWVYPCSSVVLNDMSKRSFHKKYRWVKMENLYKLYNNNIQPFNTSNCTHCVFTKQNEIVESVMSPNGMEDFV